MFGIIICVAIPELLIAVIKKIRFLNKGKNIYEKDN